MFYNLDRNLQIAGGDLLICNQKIRDGFNFGLNASIVVILNRKNLSICINYWYMISWLMMCCIHIFKFIEIVILVTYPNNCPTLPNLNPSTPSLSDSSDRSI